MARLAASTLFLASCSGEDVHLGTPANCADPSPPLAGDAAPIGSALANAAAAGPITDEGMWLYNDFPSDKVKARYGFAPDQAWLDHVRLASVRLARGCSGSIVSPSGLVMTNHHCASTCIQQLSTKAKDFIATGFYAKTEKDEVKCPDIEINELTDISDVTARVQTATAKLADKAFSDALRAETSKIEKECATGDNVRCDVVSLYQGGRYHLYKYRRFQDVRLVFAPEFDTAFFGGDPDNFNFPRYDLDVSFLRIYDGGKPAKIDHWFKWSANGAKAGELTFLPGNPGGTSRSLTKAQLEYQRDVSLPDTLLRFSELRGLLTEFANRGPEQARIGAHDLFLIENAIKAFKGRERALLDPEVFGAKVAAENALRAKVEADPALKATAGAWDAIAAVKKLHKDLRPRQVFLETGAGFDSDLFEKARGVVRLAEEATKPNDQRLREYTESRIPILKQTLLSTAPVYDEYEIFKLTAGLTKLREVLGVDDPVVRRVLGKKAPKDLATELVKGSKLKDPKVVKALIDGGKTAVDASTDPMIALAKLVDPDARAVRKEYEEKVESVEKKNAEAIAKARFTIYGTSVYPDATFTPRLCFGHVEGWEEAGKPVNPFTNFGGAFDRATGKAPFALPKSWIDAKPKLDLNAPLDFVTTNDSIGGNSGAPALDKDAEIVGIFFDGNIESLGGEYVYDQKSNRAVAVHSSALLQAFDKIYGAQRLLAELEH